MKITITSLLAAVIFFSLIEGSAALSGHPAPPLQAFHLMAGHALLNILQLLPTIIFCVIISILTNSPARNFSPKTNRLMNLSIIIITLVYCVYLRSILMSYDAFRGHLPLEVGLIFLGLFLGFEAILSRTSSKLRHVFSISMLATTATFWILNYSVERNLYATLHHAALLAGFVTLFRFTSWACRRFLRRNRQILVGSTMIIIALATSSTLSQKYRTYFFHNTALGKLATKSIVDNTSGEGATPIKDGAEYFASALPFPALQKFKLEDYNILLVVADTLRFDKTSIAQNKFNTTPNLKKFAQSGWISTRAYSPASGTRQTMSSVLTMKYLSAVGNETYAQPWNGKLLESETTVAELLKHSGYHTFWIGHNINDVFSTKIKGLEQGFDEVTLLDCDNSSKDVDAEIARASTDKLSDLAKSSQPFFGMIFLISPHMSYLNHDYDDLPSLTRTDNYLQEIRFLDEQFAKIWNELERTGLKEKTIIIFMSDHGEEFYEHGSGAHNTSVYNETTHVPLITWIPKQPPGIFSSPMSTMSMLPWLMLKSENEKVKTQTEEICETVLAPYLKATGNAAITELIGRDSNRTALTYKRWKLIYNHQSALYELYDIISDPLESMNIYGKLPKVSRKLTALFNNYKAVRAQSKKYKIIDK